MPDTSKIVATTLIAALLMGSPFPAFSAEKTEKPQISKGLLASKRNPYPYKGPIYRQGEAVPLCEATKESANYIKKKWVKFLTSGKDGWLFRTIDFKTNFATTETTERYLRMLEEALDAKNQELIIVVQPSRGFMSKNRIDPTQLTNPYDPEAAKVDFKKFIANLNEWGIYAPDLTDAPAEMDFFRRADLHWTLDGSKWSAQIVGDYLKSLDGYEDLRKAEFETTKTPNIIYNQGVFFELLQDMCKINIEFEEQPEWVTIEKLDDSADSLFGETSFPEITLAGTSNTALATYNFAGWLKETIKADVYNVAIPGGGFGSSMLRYLSSEEYIKHPPKFIIWEFPAQHNYNAEDSIDDFRQIIPAVYGECSDETALATYTASITETDTKLEQIAAHDVRNAYLFLEITGPIERKLQLEILYANGEGGIADISRDQKVVNNGKYYYMLDGGLGKKAMFINIISDNPTGNIKAKLCPIPNELVKE